MMGWILGFEFLLEVQKFCFVWPSTSGHFFIGIIIYR